MVKYIEYIVYYRVGGYPIAKYYKYRKNAEKCYNRVCKSCENAELRGIVFDTGNNVKIR